ncbi:MAG: tetratricopeptide repeat protein [Deltaproteobacteria bacterium]|nr:tetratricopeptide repeat protein [Deltaproteobacteria bacterium]
MSDDESKESEGAETPSSSSDSPPSEGSAEDGDAVADAPASDDASATKAAKPSRRKRRTKAVGKDTEAATASTVTASAAGACEAQSTALARTDDTAGSADADEPRRDLPKWNRARVKRKAPKGEEQDAFQASVRKAGRGLLQRPVVVIGIIIGVAAIVAGAYAWWQHTENDKAAATTHLATAAAYEARGLVFEDLETQIADRVRPLPRPVTSTEAERRAKVDEALATLEAEGAGTPANETADLVRAARLARARDFAGAEKAYQGFVDRQPGHGLVFLAREGLTLAMEGQERWDDALAVVEPLLGEPGDFYRDQWLWHKARLLEKAGRTDESIEVYKLYVEEYPLDKQSVASQQVRAHLEKLDPSAVPPLPENPQIPGLGGLGGLGGFGP